MPVTCPCHAEPYRTVRVDEFTYQVCAMVVRAIEEGWRSDDSRLPAFDTLDMIREAVVEELEACAKIVKDRAASCTPPLVALSVLDECVAAILARKETP